VNWNGIAFTGDGEPRGEMNPCGVSKHMLFGDVGEHALLGDEHE
jgi:hypothetical protein